MCVEEKKEALKRWWSKSPFLQSQFATIITVIFLGGGAYGQLTSLKEELAGVKTTLHDVVDEQRESLKTIHDVDKKADINETRIFGLEKKVEYMHSKPANTP